MIKYLDTFAWVWGFHLALQKAIWEKRINCIWFSEIDKFAKQVYLEHFPNTPDLWDITKIDIKNLPDFDLLTWGFPCQDVSVAWKQNLDWWRTILVEYLLRILEEKKPKYFVFENVKGFMWKKFTTFRESIFERIKEAWYTFDYKILNTKDFWLPQNRERVFIVWEYIEENHLIRPGRLSFFFPKWKELKIFLKDVLEKEVKEKFYLSEKALSNPKYKRWDKYKWETDINWVIWTLTASMHKWYGNDWCPIIREQVQNFKNCVRKNIVREYDKIIKSDKWIYQAKCSSWWQDNKVWLKYSPTLRASNSFTLCKNKDYIRKLTPIECERLQGFPDWWSSNIVSNSQAYKQMWNAISVPVVENILITLCKWLNT